MRKELLFSFILLFAMASWGLSWPLSKVMTQYLSPLELVCIRFVIAAISFVPVIYMLKLSFFVPKTAIKGVLLTSFFNIAYSGMFFFGLSLGGAGNAGVITTTLAPIFSSLIGAFIYHTRLRKSEKIGLVLGVLAGGILIGFDGLMNLYSLEFLSTAFLWCCVTLSSRLATSNMQAIVLNFYASLLSGIIFFPFLFFGDMSHWSKLDGQFWICMLCVSILATTFGTSMFYQGVAVLGFSRGGSFTLLTPLFALVFSWILLGETPSIRTVFGGSVAILAIYLINFYRRK